MVALGDTTLCPIDETVVCPLSAGRTVTEVAPSTVQLSVALLPEVIWVLDAVKVTTGFVSKTEPELEELLLEEDELEELLLEEEEELEEPEEPDDEDELPLPVELGAVAANDSPPR